MAEQADVFVKNLFEDDINVIRKLPDGATDMNSTVSKGEEDRFYLAGTDVSLTIGVPKGVDLKGHPIMVRSDVDLAVLCSRTDSNWTIQIVPNDLSPDTPTTVNITAGGTEPG